MSLVSGTNKEQKSALSTLTPANVPTPAASPKQLTTHPARMLLSAAARPILARVYVQFEGKC